MESISHESEEVQDKSETSIEPKSTPACFKKPILIGKIGKFPKKIISQTNAEPKQDLEANITPVVCENTPDEVLQTDGDLTTSNKDKGNTCTYVEPNWSGLPSTTSQDYVFEVLKSGVIVDRINLMSKPYWVFGRATKTEIFMAHPTISRFHAVLQYRKIGTETDPPGFYVYDLNSTYGTFLNKGRLKPKVYAPVKVGHMLKLGCSTRSYILTGPDDDIEEESQFTVTELKKQRAEKILKQELAEKEAIAKREKEIKEKIKRDEERGVDWGLGEDANEETDLGENPFAQTNNEELYIDDPKKALRGFMEREGHDLDYDCTEQGFGQFLCKVELPIDDDLGRSIVAEVLHKGKKKEAVVQCALEACKILDRYGLLRQATHESRKRKAKNWEENDYYDSDDDTFLDRTGAIEKKREKRMQSKLPSQPETYQGLLDKENEIVKRISQIEKQLYNSKSRNSNNSSNTEEDSLDSYMKELKDTSLDKQTISKLRSELSTLKVEHLNVAKLANLAKPAELPELIQHNKDVKQAESSGGAKQKTLPIFGKRRKIKVQLPAKPSKDQQQLLDVEDDEKTDEGSLKDRLQEPVAVKESDKNSDDEQLSVEELEKRKKKNQRRLVQRREKAELEKLKGYKEDSKKENYNMWVPPGNQTGDGKTSLNDKFGY